MRDLMTEAAHEIRNIGADEDMWTPANAFETNVGNFWKIRNTRPYMTAKLEVVRALSSISSRPAIEAALTEAMDCLRLCRSDNIGIRDVIPPLMLLLGQYQEAYDFIKWYGTSGQDMHYDWANMELPYLDIHGADMTEELQGSNRNLFFVSSLTFIKMMLAKGVKEAISAHELESLLAVVTHSLGEFLAPEGNARSLEDLKKLHTKLMRQVQEVFSLTHSQNEHYWKAMLDPTPVIQMPEPQYYARGDVNEVKTWVLQNDMLWHDHREFIP